MVVPEGTHPVQMVQHRLQFIFCSLDVVLKIEPVSSVFDAFCFVMNFLLSEQKYIYQANRSDFVMLFNRVRESNMCLIYFQIFFYGKDS